MARPSSRSLDRTDRLSVDVLSPTLKFSVPKENIDGTILDPSIVLYYDLIKHCITYDSVEGSYTAAQILQVPVPEPLEKDCFYRAIAKKQISKVPEARFVPDTTGLDIGASPDKDIINYLLE
jgi:hypothetical protein